MEKYNCPRCNTSYAYGSKFCHECGCDLEMELTEHQTNYEYQENYSSASANIYTNSSSSDTYTSIEEEGNIGETTLPSIDFDEVELKAPFGARLHAYFLDSLIAITLAIPSIIFALLGVDILKHAFYFSEVIIFFVLSGLLLLLPLLYMLLKDGMGKGQSIGKKVVGLTVINVDTLEPCSKGQSFLRNFILMFLNTIPVIGNTLEVIIAVIAEDGKRLGDRAVRTQVIEIEHVIFELDKINDTESTSEGGDILDENDEKSDILLFMYILVVGITMFSQIGLGFLMPELYRDISYIFMFLTMFQIASLILVPLAIRDGDIKPVFIIISVLASISLLLVNIQSLLE
ncbi:RDD family protein [Flammeovirga aprica]|uniref:RDD family protein n=1 Tax=Flammeovirga aprica JL-4 TaxID=694437 RepID=A0A7X9RZ45_9BACT|nr:RDD family protein [Flammeovirga aprica]NME71400.1 RDD family protein [Flammeovirga aprica JL-4]